MSQENKPAKIKMLELHREAVRNLRVRTSVKTGLVAPSIPMSNGCSCAVGGVSNRKPPPHDPGY